MMTAGILHSSVLKEFEEVAYAKVVLVGTSNVGKTSLVNKFCYKKFNKSEQPTTQVDFVSVKINLPDMDKPIILQIWDTAGQERFSSMNVAFLRRAAAAIVVYDVTRRDSFNKVNRFVSDVRNVIPEAVVVIVGNKQDCSTKRVLTFEEGNTLAAEYEYPFIETSALTGYNVDNLFNNLAKTLCKKNKKAKEDSIKLTGSTSKRRSHCCKS